MNIVQYYVDKISVTIPENISDLRIVSLVVVSQHIIPLCVEWEVKS